MNRQNQTRSGLTHYNAGRYELALQCFRGAVASGDRSPKARCFMAHALDSSGRTREAVRILSALLREHPRYRPASSGLSAIILRALSQDPSPRAESLLRKALKIRAGKARIRREAAKILRSHGQAAVSAGLWAKAERLLRLALKIDPGSAEALQWLGQAYASEGRWKKAEKVLRLALKIDPGNVAALRWSAQACVCAGRWGEAEKALRRALALKTDDAAVRRELVETLRGRARACLCAGRPAMAERALREALAWEPRSAAIRRDLAAALQARGRAHESGGRLELAEKALRQARIFDPSRAEFLRRLAAALRERMRAHHSASPLRSHDLGMLRLREQLYRVTGRLTMREKTLNLILEIAPERSIERFKTLMNLRRYAAALDLAERILDDAPSLAEVWGFANPWDWEDWTARDIGKRQLARDLERHIAAPRRRPWLYYYRVCLSRPGALSDFERLASFPLRRYGWMYLMAGRTCLLEGSLSKAVAWLKIASRQKPLDWRASALLAEAYFVLHRRKAARAEMDRAKRMVSAADEGLLLAWRGALDLWAGDYEEALRRLERACAMGAPHAFCWRAAALLKLGKPAEALEKLNATLSRFPGDLEAYLWRAEAKRELGLYDESLKDLNQSPPGVWSLVNRALVKGALQDHAGMTADFKAIPKKVVDYIERKLEMAPAPEPGIEEMRRVLEAALRLSLGWRREEYAQSLWMI